MYLNKWSTHFNFIVAPMIRRASLKLPKFFSSPFSIEKKNGIFLNFHPYFQQFLTMQTTNNYFAIQFLHATADTFRALFIFFLYIVFFMYISFVVTLANAVNSQHVLLATETFIHTYAQQSHLYAGVRNKQQNSHYNLIVIKGMKKKPLGTSN